MPAISVTTEITKLQKQIEALYKRQAALFDSPEYQALVKVAELAEDNDIVAEAIAAVMKKERSRKTAAAGKASGADGANAKKGALAGRKIAMKYANPTNKAEKWTGRGIAPKWAQKLKSAGKLEAALIKG